MSDDPATAEARRAALAPYRIDDALLDLAAPRAIALHCLPAHPGEEITAEVLYGERQRIWDQAENRRHAQKALLELLVIGLSSSAQAAHEGGHVGYARRKRADDQELEMPPAKRAATSQPPRASPRRSPRRPRPRRRQERRKATRRASAAAAKPRRRPGGAKTAAKRRGAAKAAAPGRADGDRREGQAPKARRRPGPLAGARAPRPRPTARGRRAPTATARRPRARVKRPRRRDGVISIAEQLAKGTVSPKDSSCSRASASRRRSTTPPPAGA